MTDKQIKEEIKQVVTNLGNIEFTVEDELKFCKEVLKRKEQECEELKAELELFKTSNQTTIDQLKAENEELKKQLMQKSEVDMFFNTPVEGWSNDPCGICPHKAENEQLKEELSVIQHNCNREGCKYYDDDTFKVFYECKAQKALQLSANSVTTKYCDLLQTLAEIRNVLDTYYDDDWKATREIEKILQKINECEINNG